MSCSVSKLTPSADPLTVLIIDDDESTRRLTKILLEQKGMRVEVAVNGRSGLEKLLHRQFDVVVSDYRMAEMDGLTFVQEALRIWPWLGIIMISGYKEPKVVGRAHELGVHRFLDKPIQLGELSQAVRETAEEIRHRPEEHPSVANPLMQRHIQLLNQMTVSAIQQQNLGQALEEFAVGLQSLTKCDLVGALAIRGEQAFVSIHARSKLNPSAVDQIREYIRERYQALSGQYLEDKEERMNLHGDFDASIPAAAFVHKIAVPVIEEGQLLGLLFVAHTCTLCKHCNPAFLYHAANHLSTMLRAMAEIRRQALVDPLTGAYNRHYFDAVIDRVWAMSTRHRRPLALMMVDMDNLKGVNDTQGHQVGDGVIATFAREIRALIRASDIFIRFGGDEFVLILPQTCSEEAGNLARRIIRHMEQHTFPHQRKAGNIHCSIGVAVYEPGMRIFSPADLLAHADQALYRVKQNRKNHFAFWAPESKPTSPTTPHVEGGSARDRNQRSALLTARAGAWRNNLEEWLKEGGVEVTTRSDPAEARKLLETCPRRFDLLLAELLPDSQGFDALLEAAPGIAPATVCLGVGERPETEQIIDALRHRTYDVFVFPSASETMSAQLDRALDQQVLKRENIDYQHELEILVRQKHKELTQSLREIEHAYEFSLAAMVQMLDAREYETGSHSQRVKTLTRLLARHMDLPSPEVREITRGALLHDIGKIAIPDTILRKPGSLTPEEVQIMRSHPEIGYGFLKNSSFLKTAAEIVYCHHEAYDGTGYPRGLREEEIPLGARIFSLVDSYDAMRSTRIYKASIPKEKALKEVREQSGRQFDPNVAVAFFDVVEELEEEAQWPRLTRERETV